MGLLAASTAITTYRAARAPKACGAAARGQSAWQVSQDRRHEWLSFVVADGKRRGSIQPEAYGNRGSIYRVRRTWFYGCQNSYFKATRVPFSRYVAEPMRELGECLKAAEAYTNALRDLWIGLLAAAPFLGRESEMRRAMAQYEIVFAELHAIQALLFGR